MPENKKKSSPEKPQIRTRKTNNLPREDKKKQCQKNTNKSGAEEPKISARKPNNLHPADSEEDNQSQENTKQSAPPKYLKIARVRAVS